MGPAWMLLGVVLGQAGAASTAEAPAPRRVVVLPVTARGGVLQDAAELYTARLLLAVGNVPGVRALSQAELAAEQPGGRDMPPPMPPEGEAAAFAIATSLPVDEVVHASAGTLGGVLVVHVVRMDVRQARVVERAMVQVPSNQPAEVLRQLDGAVAQVFHTRAAATAGPPATSHPPVAAQDTGARKVRRSPVGRALGQLAVGGGFAALVLIVPATLVALGALIPVALLILTGMVASPAFVAVAVVEGVALALLGVGILGFMAAVVVGAISSAADHLLDDEAAAPAPAAAPPPETAPPAAR